MKKTMIIFLSIIGVVILILVAAVILNSTPLTKEQALSSIQKIIEKEIGKKGITNAIVLIDSPSYDINKEFMAGNLDSTSIIENQPFHIASVGKAFTATLIGCFIDDGKIRLDDKISDYLSDDVLYELFTVDGVDYSKDVSIKQLLNHTSGVADYFADPVYDTKQMNKWILENPDKLWTPIELVNFSREHQQPVAAPGEVFHYSDTGYILLGLLIESVSDENFGELLYDRIFGPLNMNDSYLMFYSNPHNPTTPIADVWFEGVNIKDYNSLSIDWAGGGIVSTARDLSTFIRAFNNSEIISQGTLDSLYQFNEKFMKGIHYGNGFMEYHFGEFFPTMNSMPNYVGHMGVLGTQMFYDKTTDTTYISSFGSTDYSAGSVQTMIKILSVLMRIK